MSQTHLYALPGVAGLVDGWMAGWVPYSDNKAIPVKLNVTGTELGNYKFITLNPVSFSSTNRSEYSEFIPGLHLACRISTKIN